MKDRLRRIFRSGLFRVAAVCAGAFCAAVLGGALYYGGWASRFDFSAVGPQPAVEPGDPQIWIAAPAAEIPAALKEAVVATEDGRFYRHRGVDPLAIFRAAAGNVAEDRITSGASTITQQLARNLAEMPERTFDRKVREIFLALRIERRYSKDEILTLYLNRIFFGGHLYGIGAASRAYFGKPPRDLTLSESALLAGIISGPNLFSPWYNPPKAREARARALGRMRDRGYITPAQMEGAMGEPLVLRPLG